VCVVLSAFVCTAVVHGQEQEGGRAEGQKVASQGIKTRIGILDFDVVSDDANLKTQAVDVIIGHLADIGAYEISTNESLVAGYEQIRQRFPQKCREPRCACEIGSTLQLDRLIYGSIEQSEKMYAVRLTMVDVMSRQIIEKTELEGDPGVGLSDVLKAAVQKLHGQLDENADTLTHRYFGPRVDNRKQLAVAAPLCVGGGLVFGLAGGSLGKKDENSAVANVDYIKEYGAMESDMDDMMGVGAGAHLIPMFGRPGALANAYVAASDDAYGVFFNPAGLGWLAGGEAALGYQYRFGLDNVAASFVNKATREIGFGEGFLYNSDRDNLFYEAYFYSSIAYKLNEWIPFMRPIGFGATVKVISKGTGEAQSVSSVTGSAFGLGLDLGAQLELSENIRGGILFRDLPAVLRWYNSLSDTSYMEPVPAAFYWGGTFQAGYQTFMICEVQTPLNEDQVWRFAGGIERIIFRVFRIRAGIQKEADFDTPWKFTGGFGLRVNTERMLGKYLILDGSYEYNTLTTFAHPVNISFRFGF